MTDDAHAQSPHHATTNALPVGAREFVAVAAMLLMFVASQLLAVLLIKPFTQAGVQGFEDPTAWTNGVWLIGTILVFTAIILWIARKKRERVIQWIILGSVGLTLIYVFFPLLLQLPIPATMNPDVVYIGAVFVAIPPAVVLTILLYKFPEWYIVDVVGVLVAAGGIAIFGSSFTPRTYLLVLVGTAIYDYISVYKTKHMLSLADSVLNYHLPIMLVVPKHLDYSFRTESTQLRKEADLPRLAPATAHSTMPAPVTVPITAKKPRDAMFLGLGDIVIPSIFAMTALPVSATAAAASLLGVVAGFLFLMGFVLRGKPQAGLPALNTGALLGFLVGFWFDKHTLVFWH